MFDTIMLDNAVKVAKDFARRPQRHADHRRRPTTPTRSSIIGAYNDNRPGQLLRDKLGVYNGARPSAELPGPRDADGYPDRGRHLAPPRRRVRHLSRLPAIPAAPIWTASAFPAVAGAEQGHLCRQREGLHGADGGARSRATCPSTANSGRSCRRRRRPDRDGPGRREVPRPQVDNTLVFRVMTEALALGGE